MKQALGKVLKNYVLDNIDFIDYDIKEYMPTDEVKKFEVEIYIHGGTPMTTAEEIKTRLKEVFEMFGLRVIRAYIYNEDQRDKLVIKVEGSKSKFYP